jgi:hypothetical protein
MSRMTTGILLISLAVAAWSPAVAEMRPAERRLWMAHAYQRLIWMKATAEQHPEWYGKTQGALTAFKVAWGTKMPPEYYKLQARLNSIGLILGMAGIIHTDAPTISAWPWEATESGMFMAWLNLQMAEIESILPEADLWSIRSAPREE